MGQEGEARINCGAASSRDARIGMNNLLNKRGSLMVCVATVIALGISCTGEERTPEQDIESQLDLSEDDESNSDQNPEDESNELEKDSIKSVESEDGTENEEEDPSSPEPSPEKSEQEPSPDKPKKPKATPKTKAELCDALDAQVKATADGKDIVTWWEAFVDGYPGREFRGKKNQVAAKYLRSQLEELGYETEILELDYKGRRVKVVQGLMQGSEEPNKYTVIGAHYDHVSATASGAYDNASGVATVMSICSQLAKTELRRSHACLFFDAEENGLWGSAAWVQNFVKKKSEDLQVVQMFGFDMAGLNWPGKTAWPLHGTVGLPRSMRSKLMEPHATTIETVLLKCVGDEIGMKPEGLKVLRVYDKSSDEISFMHGGVPIIRFFGGRKATDYPYYHKKGDTKDGVYKVAGGRENFEIGIEMAVKSSYYTILAFDLFDPKEAVVLPE